LSNPPRRSVMNETQQVTSWPLRYISAISCSGMGMISFAWPAWPN